MQDYPEIYVKDLSLVIGRQVILRGNQRSVYRWQNLRPGRVQWFRQNHADEMHLWFCASNRGRHTHQRPLAGG